MTQQVRYDIVDLSLKYDTILKLWPANTLDISVERLTAAVPAQRMITTRPASGTALFAELKTFHGEHDEAEYEIKFYDVTTKVFRGNGRIVMPDTRPRIEQPSGRAAAYDGMKADIRAHKPLREDVRSGLTTLLVQARQIWGNSINDKLTLAQIVVRLMVVVGDIARIARDTIGASVSPNQWIDGTPKQELKKELGNIILSTIRWIDDLGLDPLECLDLAIEAQEKFVKSGRPR